LTDKLGPLEEAFDGNKQQIKSFSVLISVAATTDVILPEQKW
jgi:hypothetical protein